MKKYDCIVIGGGHAGIEAALAVSRMGSSTLLITLKRATIGLMSCNPAIGGVGKGQLVKEIDALGGFMAEAADACGIQFRILNASKGPAVQSSRAQIDMELYQRYAQEKVSTQERLDILEAEVESLLLEENKVAGVKILEGEEIYASCVVIATGTFINGLIHVGLKHHSGGRINEPASLGLGKQLGEIGFNLLRFKTGTPARLDKPSINFNSLDRHEGDVPPKPFSFFTRVLPQPQVPCHLTYTNARTHKVIRDNLNRSPLYAGIIQSTGVRYCPSIEDKVVKFPEKVRHQVFLEPQGLNSALIYPNGISTSLPEDVQLEMIHSIPGLEEARVVTFGYGIEHTVVEPTQVYPTLETKLIRNLYIAGQMNGTTGYEEAAAQGLLAGINAGLRLQNREPLILDRASSYIGVLIDDLTTKGTAEPYRMFTSRVEHRLIIREDNADLRLGKIGYEAGLLSEAKYSQIRKKSEDTLRGLSFCRKQRIKGIADLKKSLTIEEYLKRPEVDFKQLMPLGLLDQEISESAWRQVEIEVKYAGFIQRQLKEVERFEHLEKIRIPENLDYKIIHSLSREISEKLTRFKPLNLGQASRISGVTPAAIALLMVYLKKFKNEK